MSGFIELSEITSKDLAVKAEQCRPRLRQDQRVLLDSPQTLTPEVLFKLIKELPDPDLINYAMSLLIISLLTKPPPSQEILKYLNVVKHLAKEVPSLKPSLENAWSTLTIKKISESDLESLLH